MAAIELSEAEVSILRDEAQEEMLRRARERLGTSTAPIRDVDQQRETERMMGAAEVYGATRDAWFVSLRGAEDHHESVGIEFTARAMVWMASQRAELQDMLARQRGSCEVNLEHSPRETFLLFVLDGICGGER